MITMGRRGKVLFSTALLVMVDSEIAIKKKTHIVTVSAGSGRRLGSVTAIFWSKVVA